MICTNHNGYKITHTLLMYLAPESNTLHNPPNTDSGTKREKITSPAVPKTLYPNGYMNIHI